MAEVTYRSPGFFESEIDLSITTPGEVTATPAGVIGPTPIGPAFVPVTVASLSQFRDRFFGSDNERNNSYYAGQEFFRNGSALTFLRTLGAGANSTSTDITATQGQGTVKGAGFVIKGSTPAVDPRAQGAVQSGGTLVLAAADQQAAGVGDVGRRIAGRILQRPAGGAGLGETQPHGGAVWAGQGRAQRQAHAVAQDVQRAQARHRSIDRNRKVAQLRLGAGQQVL